MNTSGKHPPVHPLLAICVGLFAVSTASIFIRYAQGYAPSLVIAAFRLSLATIFLTPLAVTRQRNELASLNWRDIILAMLSGAFLAVHFATWISSLEYTSVASSVVLVSTNPLFVALLAPFFLKEHLTRFALLGLVLALAGGIIVGVSDTCSWEANRLICPPLAEFTRGEAFWGDLLALAGAAAGACYVMLGRRLRVKISLISYIFVVYGMAAIILVVCVFAASFTTHMQPWGYPAIAYLWFILLAVVPQLIGHSTFNWALRYFSAAFVSITLLGEPIGSTILAYLLLNETPPMLRIFGAILILAGIVIASLRE